MRRAVLLLLALLAAPVLADVVVLTDGKRIAGTIVEESPERIVLEVAVEGAPPARVVVPRDTILEIRTRPLAPAELLERGERWLAEDRVDAAEGAFEEARLAARGSADAYHGLARVEARRGRFRQAIRQARKGIVLSRSHPELHRTLGLLYAEVGDLGSAIRMLERAIALAPFTPLEAAARRDLDRLADLVARVAAGDPLAGAARRDYDPELGNNRDAADLGAFAGTVVRNLAPRLAHDLYVEVRATAEAEYGYGLGAPLGPYRASVQTVQFSMLVDAVGWAGLTELEQRALVGGWLRHAKDLYPFATVFAVVHDTHRIVFEAVWSDLRHDVIFHVRRPSDH